MWKIYVKLAAISLVFLAAFSGLWGYSLSENSPASFQPQLELHVQNSTSELDYPLTLPSVQHLASYGSGGQLFFYDGLLFNSSLNAGNSYLIVLVNSSNSSGISYSISYNLSSNQTTGQIGLPLKPGYYAVNAKVIINVGMTGNVNLTHQIPFVKRNVAGEFIVTIVKPGVTVFTFPVILSASFIAMFSVVSFVDYRRKFLK